jgi:hypothetical protein
VGDGSISEAKLADAAVTASKIADGSVDESKLADESVTAAKLAEGAVTADNIEDGAVSTVKINTVGAGAGQTLVFADGELQWGAPSGQGVISEVEAGNGLEGGGTSGTVTLGIASEGIGSGMIGENAIRNEHLATNAVNTDEIANEAVTGAKIGVGALPLNRLTIDGAAEDELLTFNGNTPVWQALEIPNGSIVTNKIEDGAVTRAKLSTQGASADEVLTYNGTAIIWEAPPGAGPGSVGTSELADDAVTTAKLADDAVATAQLQNGAVSTAKLENQAVATNKIEDAAVTAAKIANSAVDSQQLANNAVTSAKLADESVMLANINVSEGSNQQVLTIQGNSATWAAAGAISPGSVGTDELADNSVSTAKIQTSAVTTGKIDNTAVTTAKLEDGAVTTLKIAPLAVDPLLQINTTGGSPGQFLVLTGGGVLQWTNTIPGDLNVTGDLTKGGGSFKIDHPLDPKNKYLYHSFVESDEMMNVYSGNVDLDADGRAVVKLPDWFEAVNQDFRYQLTCIGGYAPVYIEKEIEDGSFVVAGGSPDLRVSWQVTAVRHDPFANMRRIEVEVEKPAGEKGTYLHPEAYK